MQSRQTDHLHHQVDYIPGDRYPPTYKIKIVRPTSTAIFTSDQPQLRSSPKFRRSEPGCDDRAWQHRTAEGLATLWKRCDQEVEPVGWVVLHWFSYLPACRGDMGRRCCIHIGGQFAVLEIAVMGDLNIGNYDNFASLEAETLRVKSSLLYADQITLESPKVQLLLTRYGVRSRFLVDLMKEQGLTEEFIELMAERLEGDSSKKSSHKKAFIELLRGGDHSAFFEMLESAKEAMRSIDRRSIDPNMILQAWGPLALQYRLQSLQCTGGGYPIESARAFSDLIEMSKTGLLKVSTGATWDVFTAGSSNIAEAVDLAIYGISQSIASAEPVRHLLFSSAERLRLDPEVVTEESFELSLSNRAALAGSLVASLPSFPRGWGR